MSFVIVTPDALAAASSGLSSIDAAIKAASAAVKVPTTQLLSAAEDEVSAAIAALFRAQGQGYQTLSAQAAEFQTRFIQALSARTSLGRRPPSRRYRSCSRRCSTRSTRRLRRCWAVR